MNISKVILYPLGVYDRDGLYKASHKKAKRSMRLRNPLTFGAQSRRCGSRNQIG
jgi:hypothetical protein